MTIRLNLDLASEATDPAKRLRYLAFARVDISHAIAEEVANWREDGASWSDVGDALGISRQAAQQRYGRI